MRELSVAEQRYEAVRAVIADGETVTDVAARFGVARETVHVWLAKYEAGGLPWLADRSHRPRSCPHQMPAAVEVALGAGAASDTAAPPVTGSSARLTSPRWH
jgi:transposase-like protein